MRLVPCSLASAAALLAACTPSPGPTPPPAAATSALPTAAASTAELAVAPVGGHPRLWLTAADLPRLRGWATSQNPLYRDGLRLALDNAVATYDKEFFPGGNENPTWPDPGTQGWVGRSTEAYAEFFAFLSLVDPDETARARHAERAR